MKYLRFYTYSLFNGLQLDRWLWVLYLSHRGFTLAEIGIAKVVFEATVLITEIPSGYLADRFGKRPFLIAGGLAAAASALALRNGITLSVVLLAMVLRALAYTLPSGSDAAYLNDAVVSANEEHQLGKILGHFGTTRSFGQFIGGIAGGGLAELSWSGLYAVDFALALGRVAAAVSLPSSVSRRHGSVASVPSNRPAWGHRMMALGGVILLIGLASTYWSVSTVKFLFAQPLLGTRGIGPGVIAMALSCTDLLSMAGSYLGGHLPPGFRRMNHMTWIAACDALVTTLLISPIVHINLLALGASQILIGVSSVVITREILERSPEDLQATFLSGLGTFSSLLSAGGFVLIGTLNSMLGNTPAVLALVSCLAILATIASAIPRKKVIHESLT